MPQEGYEVPGDASEVPDEFIYSSMAPGKYFIEVSAAGYLNVRLSTEITTQEPQKSLLVIMKPRPASQRVLGTVPEPSAPEPRAESALPAPSVGATRNFWKPHELEETIPRADAQLACPQETVLVNVGERMKEFVGTLEKFTAVESLEHYAINQAGERKAPETRKFNYVVAVSQNREGTFLLEEFRNGASDPAQFPAGIASIGLPAIDLLFHPLLAADFDLHCEGLGQIKGRRAWQVHFVQRADKPVRIRSYHIGRNEFPVQLEGRAWIDPPSFQVLRLESQLLNPIPEIDLKLEHLTIDYAPVQFHSTGQEVWLPQVAELYVDRQKKRYFRRHTFSNFELFNVDTAQKLQTKLGSYVVINLSDKDVACELKVSPAAPTQGQTAILRFSVPAHATTTKVVGLGRDVNLSPDAVASSVLTHNGNLGQVVVETSLVSGTDVRVTAVGKAP